MYFYFYHEDDGFCSDSSVNPTKNTPPPPKVTGLKPQNVKNMWHFTSSTFQSTHANCGHSDSLLMGRASTAIKKAFTLTNFKGTAMYQLGTVRRFLAEKDKKSWEFVTEEFYATLL